MSNNPCELEALNTQFQARFRLLALCDVTVSEHP